MIFSYPFNAQDLYPTDKLPATLISLEDWALVRISGQDRFTYLQGQLTYDLNTLLDSQSVFSGHCDAKGKLWSNLLLFRYNDEICYLIRRSVVEQQLAELKKYAIFSKITFTLDTQSTLFGVAGKGARSLIAPFFNQLPDNERAVVQRESLTLIAHPHDSERFLCLVPADKSVSFIEKLNITMLTNNSAQWLLLDIIAGFPIIEKQTLQQFLPQSCNLQLLDAISFQKGCYCGQEMVARSQYRGANKWALYLLTGPKQRLPEVGDSLEMSLGNSWRKTGTVLAAVQQADGDVYVQVVLRNDTEADVKFRAIGESNNILTPQPLPYTIN